MRQRLLYIACCPSVGQPSSQSIDALNDMSPVPPRSSVVSTPLQPSAYPDGHSGASSDRKWKRIRDRNHGDVRHCKPFIA